jgi:hypothetical protein
MGFEQVRLTLLVKFPHEAQVPPMVLEYCPQVPQQVRLQEGRVEGPA